MTRDRLPCRAPVNAPGKTFGDASGNVVGRSDAAVRTAIPGPVLELLASGLLACPACYQPLAASIDQISCTGCRRSYPIEDGIPILLVDRALQPAP